MALFSVLMVLTLVATATEARAGSEENELDYGYWNYREGGINLWLSETINHRAAKWNAAKCPDELFDIFRLVVWMETWWCPALVSADSVNVASVRSVTRVLDAWGKHIFREIKTLLHSQPSTLLPDYSRYILKQGRLKKVFDRVARWGSQKHWN